MTLRLTLCFLFCAAPAVAQQSPFLEPPLDCDIGETCFIQQYVDNDPGPGLRDFACGTQANDGHKGTDFRVATWSEMRDGVDVIASAPGIVRATRDGMQDIPSNYENAPDIEGRECGNAVVIDHDGGWQTTYCHLKRGSLQVRSEDVVTVGQKLGQIGASGSTHFPHVHLTLRKDGEVVDPFHPDLALSCSESPETTLWADLPELEFGGLMDAGFATTVPDFDTIKDGLDPLETLAPDAPALVSWGYFYATQAGDRIDLEINGPKGWSFEKSEVMQRNQAQLFRAGGRKQPRGGFQPGIYTAQITLSRNGTVLDSLTRTLTISQ